MVRKTLLAATLVIVLATVLVLISVRSPTPPQVKREELKLPNLIVQGRELALKVAEEGVVLLKNDGVLPLNPQYSIAVFGTGQNLTWWYHEGGSSYVPLNPPRVVTLLEALIEYGFKIDEEVSQAYSATTLPPKTREYPFVEEDVEEFARRNDVALIVLSRYSSEDFDLPRNGGWFSAGWWFYYYTTQLTGPYYFRGYELEEDELKLIKTVAKYFDRIVLILNTPHAVGVTPVVDDVDAILWVGYPGEVGAYAVANILMGKATPSGKLPFTWAKRWEDYPSSRCWGTVDVVYCENIYVGYKYFDTFNVEPLYPFGFGLSYTKFDINVIQVEVKGSKVEVTVRVSNTGGFPGKEVVQVYTTLPQGKLEKEHQRLVAFAKTGLLNPGQSETVKITFDIASAASFDEEARAWVLEEGVYAVKVGNSSRNARVVAKVVVPNTVFLEKVAVNLGADYFYKRARELGVEILRRTPEVVPWTYPGELEDMERAPSFSTSLESFETVVRTCPEYYPTEFKTFEAEEITLEDVVNGVYTLEELVGQMSVEELVDVTIGLRGSKAPYLSDRRIPELRQTDGPNGAKLYLPGDLHGTAFPGASTRAATWNVELEYEVGRHIGRELLWAGISIWLAPGLNIHRNPLCGRNAEYYSEDPLLAGVMAAVAVKGLQGVQGVGATPKHFVANDQEAYRWVSDSIASERALREIYLKAFEIAVKTAKPWAIMTSYNKVNGFYSGNYFNLCMGVLRGEWGFDGLVMTDWWSRSYNYVAYTAGNDALMPYTEYVSWAPWTAYEVVVKQVKEALNNGSLTLGQLQRSAYNILRVALRSRSLADMIGVSQDKLYTYEPPPDYFKVDRYGG
ncbi:MAG: glycoside hydrolase family 3 C-terminal domain-containing protein [Thermofilaceae archaeon]|nr:glycoside hydrolase family 3 C-terminal domain-containing protein [Thermofilaceae archaeon]MDW8004308.1 glycoside hydrolase family 3 C-terminal domain-containing protein [Thermofilaceae archaeon]